MEKQKILIVGNGKIGQAIFHLLRSSKIHKNLDIEVYDRDPIKNRSEKTLIDCARNANFIFLCIPSWVEEEALLEMKMVLDKHTTLITLSKGINVSAKKSMDELLEKDAKDSKYALLSGPMFAFEIIENKKSYAVLASKNKKIYENIAKLFSGTNLRLEYEKDVHSVAISAVLKNVYTIIFGMIESYGEKKNTRGFLASVAIKEMRSIMKTLKLNEKIIDGTAGMADFIATSESEHSQNRKLGKEIFETGKATFKSEGLVSISSLFKMLGKNSSRFPLLSLIEKILIGKKNAKKEIEKFLNKI